MDHELTADQELLRSTTARYSADSCPIERVRELFEHETGMPDGYLEGGAQLGWFSLLVPESLGGGSVSGDGIVDAMVVAEARGAALQPGPFAGANAIVRTLAASGTSAHQRDVLPAVMAGEVAAWVNGDVSAAGVGSSPLRVTATGKGWRIDGTVAVVQDALAARWFLISANNEDRMPLQFLVAADHPGLLLEHAESLDLTRRIGRVHCKGLLCDMSNRVGDATAAARDTRAQSDLAAVLSAADSVGALGKLFAMAVDYAKTRVAFGRPIGGFQAIKHLLADVSLSLEMARATTVGAARAIQRDDANASMLASAASAFVGDAAVEIAQGCFQVHGGIGHTWEHDLHLYLRRAAANAALFGDPVTHRERLFRLAGCAAT